MSTTERCGVCGAAIKPGRGEDRGEYLECDRCAIDSLDCSQDEERAYLDRDRAADVRAQGKGRP